MRKTALVAVLMIVVLVMASTASFAWSRGGNGFHHGGFRGGVVIVGPGCCWGPYWGWGWGGYYPPPYYYQPQVVVQPAPVYENAPPAESYWYYCPSSKAYYPNVPSCGDAWVKVPPRSE